MRVFFSEYVELFLSWRELFFFRLDFIDRCVIGERCRFGVVFKEVFSGGVL